MLGISVYFKDFEMDYLEGAARQGAKIVFTSLHIPEDNINDIKKNLSSLIKKCKELNLLLVPDISPRTFEKLDLKSNDIEGLKQLGFNAIRLDFGFDSPQKIAELQNDFIVMLNASTVDKTYLIECESTGVNLQKLILTHNFYPHKNTGLDEITFLEKNQTFVNMGMRIQAFVCGDDLKRYPLYEGLPTLEKHRGLNPYVAAVELIKKYHISEIIIGDSKAKLETLRYINDYMEKGIITIKAFLENGYEYLFDEEISIRKDSGKLIRLIKPRVPNITTYHTLARGKGAITIDNKLYGRYSGEISIVKEDLESDSRVNVIGYIHPEYIPLLSYIDDSISIKFVK